MSTTTTTPAALLAAATGAAPWTPIEAGRLAASARRVLSGETFASHGHAGHGDELTRENCAACVLRGYGLSEETGAPDHCAWARIYVQAQRPIPAAYVPAFLAELAEPLAELAEPTAYAAALLRDLATFGARVLPA